MAVYLRRTNEKLDRVIAIIVGVVALLLIGDGFFLAGLSLAVVVPLLWYGTQHANPSRAFIVRILAISICFISAGLFIQ